MQVHCEAKGACCSDRDLLDLDKQSYYSKPKLPGVPKFVETSLLKDVKYVNTRLILLIALIYIIIMTISHDKSHVYYFYSDWRVHQIFKNDKVSK